MNLQGILWIMGVAITLELAVIGFLIKWHLRTDERLAKTESALSDFKVECLRSFVDSGDMSRLSTSIEQLRGELNTIASDVRKELTEVAKGLNQLIGQTTHRG